MSKEIILKDTMQIIENLFYLKCKNSDLVLNNDGDKGWYYINPKTAFELKRLLIKYKTRK